MLEGNWGLHHLGTHVKSLEGTHEVSDLRVEP
jgi:hypothetical protein